MNSEILKTHFNTEEYTKLKLILNYKYQEYCKKYKFLNLEKITIQKWFYEAIKTNINAPDLINCIENHLETLFTSYFNNLINNKDTSILSNILKEISANTHNKRQILEILYNKLEDYNINLDEEYFNKFKKESKEFYTLLQTLKINSFTNSEIKMLNTGKYDFYLNLSFNDHNLSWIISTFEYINSLLVKKYDLESDIRDVYLIQKFKTIMKNYDLFEKMTLSIMKYYPNKDYINQIIFNLGAKSFDDLLKLYKEYQKTSDEAILNAIIAILFKNKENIFAEKRLKTIYDEFPLITDDATRKEQIDYLVNELSENDKKDLFEYLENKFEEIPNQKGKELYLMLKTRYKYQKFNSIYKSSNNDRYNYFLNKDTKDYIKRFIIDILWEYLEPYDQNIFNLYFENKNSKFYIEKVQEITNKIMKDYKETLNNKHLPKYAILETIILNLSIRLSLITKLWYNLGLEKRTLLRDKIKLNELKAINAGLTKQEYYFNILTKTKNLNLTNNFNLEEIITNILDEKDISLTI